MNGQNPFIVEQPETQQPQMQMPMGMMNQMGGQIPGMGGQGFPGMGGGAGGAGGGEGMMSGMGGDMSALASNPYAWILAAVLGQNVLHNKDISSWQAGLKGQGGRNTGDHFLDQWGVDDDSKLRDVAGVLGWGSGGGILNPSYLPTKIFGETD